MSLFLSKSARKFSRKLSVFLDNFFRFTKFYANFHKNFVADRPLKLKRKKDVDQFNKNNMKRSNKNIEKILNKIYKKKRRCIIVTG